MLVRVHGRTAGGGVGIAAAADYAFAVEGASAKLSELAVGIGPFVVGPVIERRIGCGPFAAMAVDADWRDAEWCERHGLYARVLDDIAAHGRGAQRARRHARRVQPRRDGGDEARLLGGHRALGDAARGARARSAARSCSRIHAAAIAKFKTR